MSHGLPRTAGPEPGERLQQVVLGIHRLSPDNTSTSGFWPPEPWGGYMSVVWGPPVCGTPSRQPRETNAQGKQGQKTCTWEAGEDGPSPAVEQLPRLMAYHPNGSFDMAT